MLPVTGRVFSRLPCSNGACDAIFVKGWTIKNGSAYSWVTQITSRLPFAEKRHAFKGEK